MRKLIIAALVIVALAVVADFGAAAYAEHTIAQQMRQQLALTSEPSVRINGFPFLTQALAGHYSAIDLRASAVPVPPLQNLEIEATLHDVDAPLAEVSAGDVRSVRAARVDGRVRIKDTDLGRAIGIEDLQLQQPSDQEIKQLLPAGTADSPRGNRSPVRMVATTDLLGERTEIIAVGVIELTTDLIRVTISDVRLAKDSVGTTSVPRAVRQRLFETMSTTAKPGALPFAITPTSVRVETGSVVAEGTAYDVSLRQVRAGA
ncbi:MAG TPA: LmeA family phospholipid-binding protein [Pseudonocardiaceae bacterium]|nr:LmeA family phospholipid-binding protein [Pseudonocardiaceae bacterium]